VHRICYNHSHNLERSNINQTAEDEINFDRKLITLKKKLEYGERFPGHAKLYKQYFITKITPKRGTKAQIIDENVIKAKRYLGFFALISNEKMDEVTALEPYRNKDVVEKAFGNLKGRLNTRRTLVSSEHSLDGKLFVQFVALIYLSYLKKQMQDKDLFKNYTLPGMLDKLDVIEFFDNREKCSGWARYWKNRSSCIMNFWWHRPYRYE
jgi:transposase